MVFQKFSIVNNGICGLDQPIDENAVIANLRGAYDRLPASNFVLKFTEFDTDGETVIGRENIYVATRVGSIISGLVRAYEAVPIDDDATTNIQQPLPFSAGSTVELVISMSVFKDVQDEVTRLETDKADQTEVDTLSNVYASASGGTDTYTFTIPNFASYAGNVGKQYTFLSDVANIGPSNVNISGLGAIPLYKNRDIPLEDGDIEASQMVQIVIGSGGTYVEMVSQVAKVVDLTAAEPRAIWDEPYPAGETMSAGEVLFIENSPATSEANSVQNIGDLVANTRISFPTFGSGVSASTLKLNLNKVGSPGVNLGVRVETDNGSGTPSGTLVNTNANGTVTAGSLSAPTSATETVTHLPATTQSNTAPTGYRILANVARTLSIVTKNASCNATRCLLQDDFGNTIATATFSGNTASFYVGLKAGTYYRILVDSSGASYTATYNSGASFPYNNTNINFLSGTSVINSAWTQSINSIATESIPADTTVTLSGAFTIPSGQKCHIVVYQGTYGGETVNASNYYKIGYSNKDSTTRGQLAYDGSYWNTSLVSDGMNVLRDYGFSYSAFTSASYKVGMKITSTSNFYISKVLKAPACTATTVYISATVGGPVLTQATFVGNEATFSTPYKISGTFYVLVDAGGASYSFLQGGTTPTAGYLHTLNAFVVNGSEYTNIGGAITGYYTQNELSVSGPMTTGKVPYTSSSLFQNRVLSKTDADFNYKIDWNGVTQESVTSADLAIGMYPKIVTGGVDTNQAGMTQGNKMYLGNTPGSISGTVGTIQKILGEAKTPTKIELEKDLDQDFVFFERIENAVAGSVTYSHNLGKIPNFIKFDFGAEESSSSGNGSGFYRTGKNQNGCYYTNTTAKSGTSSSYCIYFSDGAFATDYQRGYVSAITDTSFTITWETLSVALTGNIRVLATLT